jgi:hypothetical protein
MISETLLTAIVTALLTGAVNWGVLSTKLTYMARDIEDLKERLRACEQRHFERRN